MYSLKKAACCTSCFFSKLKNREIAFFEFLKIWTSSKIAKLKKVRFAKKSKLKKVFSMQKSEIEKRGLGQSTKIKFLIIWQEAKFSKNRDLGPTPFACWFGAPAEGGFHFFQK